jgi:hypothetical protein
MLPSLQSMNKVLNGCHNMMAGIELNATLRCNSHLDQCRRSYENLVQNIDDNFMMMIQFVTSRADECVLAFLIMIDEFRPVLENALNSAFTTSVAC